MLSQNKDSAKQAMAALREVYDGTWDRPVGTDGGKVLHWKGKCGLVGGATPSYDRYGSVVNALGDRFLLLRLPDVDPAKQAGAALRAAQHEKADACRTGRGHAQPHRQRRPRAGHAPPSDAGEEKTLVELAEFTARVRTAVERDGYTGELLVMPQPEGPARLVKATAPASTGRSSRSASDEDTRWSVLGRVARRLRARHPRAADAATRSTTPTGGAPPTSQKPRGWPPRPPPATLTTSPC